ncbi:ArnT family glycosyltransferase [Halobacteriaceae archaeon GCM10025711]
MLRARGRTGVRPTVLALGLALLAAAVVYTVSVELFPYHSTNHDAGVYLQQAALLLDGRLVMRAGDLAGSVRPWFFVRDGGVLYPKYAPVPATLFTLGKLATGQYRLALPAIAAANVLLTYGVAAEAFDRRTGLLAAAFLLASPLFLVDSALFLPYAPITAFNLLFAFAYLRAVRRGSRAYALLAGLAIGVAFFGRPYTAVLFAAPFVVHALVRLWTRRFERETAVQTGLTAAGGLALVGVTLAYNAALTGSPLVFPYEAFAPADGLGFGHREILGYDRTYTPLLALRANAEVVWLLFTDWVAGGVFGTALAAGGVWFALRETTVERLVREYHPEQARVLLGGLFVSVVLGNVYFWGNLNLLGDLAVQGDGLVSTHGPYYHFDLLAPTAAFAAFGGRRAWRMVRSRVERSFDPPRARAVLAAGLLLATVAFGGANAAALAEPVEENAAVTAQYGQAYAPFEPRPPDDAVVFLPTPYGDWLNHPFQSLRNDPGLNGRTVYAVDDGTANFGVADAYPDRRLYRYAYRGQWTPLHGSAVDARIVPVTTVSGDAVTMTTTVGVPEATDRMSVRLASEDGSAYYAVNASRGNQTFTLAVDGDRAHLAGPGVEATGANASVSVNATDELDLEVFMDTGPTSRFSYRVELPVERTDGSVRAMTPYREVCTVPARCGGQAAYLPNQTPENVSVDVSLAAVDGSSGRG